jgi:hypothetical protein
MPTTGCTTPGTANAQPCQNLSDAVDTQDSDAKLSQILFVASGVVAAGAVVTYFVWPKDGGKKTDKGNKTDTKDETTTWLRPTFGPGHAGMGFGGRF